jgi:drug/metabolite transporter (DMT)-like permease
LLYLLGSILLSSYLTLSFKVLERFRISNFQAIVFNYLACVLTGSVVNGYFPIRPDILDENWLPWAGLMGFSFIFLFNIIAFTAQKLSVAIASVANKLSLVIPVLFSVYLYGEKLGWMQVLGILAALVAVVLTSWPAESKRQRTIAHKSNWLFLVPLVLFVGSGLLDTMIKYVEQGFLDENNKNDYLITAFGVAAVIGLMLLVLQLITGKERFDLRSMLAGLLIGIPNYFSIWCLVRVLKDYGTRSASIIPINNMGIVLFSALMAWLLFREHLTQGNIAGVVLALLAIALIAYG